MSGNKDAESAQREAGAERTKNAFDKAMQESGGEFTKAFDHFSEAANSDSLIRRHLMKSLFDEARESRPDIKDDPEALAKEVLRRVKAASKRRPRRRAQHD